MLSIKTRMRGYEDLNSLERLDILQYCIGKITGISDLLFAASSINGEWLVNAGSIADFMLKNDEYVIPLESLRMIVKNFDKARISRYKLDAMCELIYLHGDFLYESMKLQRLMLDKYINDTVLRLDSNPSGIMEDMVGPYMQLIMTIIVAIYDVSDIWDGGPISSITQCEKFDLDHPDSAIIVVIAQMLTLLGRSFMYIDKEIAPNGKYMQILKDASKIFKYDFERLILRYEDGSMLEPENEEDCVEE